MQPFTVYDIDEDDEGCIRLHVNTDISFSGTTHIEARTVLEALIDNLDDSGALDDLVTASEEEPCD